jgi:hypothetical protein
MIYTPANTKMTATGIWEEKCSLSAKPQRVATTGIKYETEDAKIGDVSLMSR